MRQMATIRKINEIRPIPDADTIECAIVGGWQVVVKKGEFTAGESALYLEIDSWVPHTLAPFLSKGKEPREYNGIKGERLRTVKLRGQISQGLLLPLKHLTNWAADDWEGDANQYLSADNQIVKYEPPIPAHLSGLVKGSFPSFIPKTDQERIQNFSKELEWWITDEFPAAWEVTEKLDGSSMTIYILNNEIGVCSRNLELKEDMANSFWKVAHEQGLIQTLKLITATQGANMALQGELVGEGIQGNPYGLKGQRFYLFDIYDIDIGEYIMPGVRRTLAEKYGLLHVPVADEYFSLEGQTMEKLLLMAEGRTYIPPETAKREGLVFKSTDPTGPTFKAISNAFLLDEK